MRVVDVAQLIDDSRFSAYQQRLVAAAALLIVLDGADNQLLANAIPSMMREWNLPRSAFATASAAAPFGMIFGGLLGGILGDRVGRSYQRRSCGYPCRCLPAGRFRALEQ